MGWLSTLGARDLDRPAGLTASHRSVLLIIAIAADDKTKKAWPSLAKIAEWSWQSKSSVCSVLRDLELHGLIERQKQQDKEGRSASTMYKYTGPLFTVRSEDTGVQSEDTGVNRGDTKCPEAGQLTVLRLDSDCPEAGHKSTTRKSKPKEQEKDTRGEAREVLEFWAETMRKGERGKDTTTTIGKSRVKLIASRLRDGYSVDDLKTAISGCSGSAFHMGQNDSGAMHNDITLICRANKVDSFIDRRDPVQGSRHAEPHEAPWEKRQRESGHSKPWVADPNQAESRWTFEDGDDL